MAKPQAKKESKEVVKKEQNLPVDAAFFEQDADHGFEGTDASSYAIPYLMILQKNSPQCDKDDGKYIDGAESGMFFNSVTNELWDGDEGLLVCPAAYQHTMVEWVPRDAGGGFVGQLSPTDPRVLKAQRNESGKFELENGNYLSDTRYHFCIIAKDDGTAEFCILGLSSTQIKKSRQWLTQMRNLKFTKADGTKITPATYSHLYRVTTIPEENEKGKWRGWKIVLERPIDPKNPADVNVYVNAKKLNEMVKQGSVQVAPPPREPGDDDTPF